MSVATRSLVEEARREKLAALRERGILPFEYGYDKTHTAREAIDAYSPDEELPVRMAGRIVAFRPHGRTTFGHVADHSGRVQFFVRRDEVGDDVYSTLKLLDLGDHVGLEGVMFTTKTGECSPERSAACAIPGGSNSGSR